MFNKFVIIFTLCSFLPIACTSARGSILTSPPFQDLRLVQSGCRWRLHFKWWVLKNLNVEPADLTPDDPVVISYILMGNCSKWLTHAFNFCTKSWNFPATSKSGTGSVSESKKKENVYIFFFHCMKKNPYRSFWDIQGRHGGKSLNVSPWVSHPA